MRSKGPPSISSESNQVLPNDEGSSVKTSGGQDHASSSTPPSTLVSDAAKSSLSPSSSSVESENESPQSVTSHSESPSSPSTSPSTSSVSDDFASSTSSSVSDEVAEEVDEEDFNAPLKLLKLEQMGKKKPSLTVGSHQAAGGSSVFPAPLLQPLNSGTPYRPAFPEYGPAAWTVPPPSLPTLSASAKDLSEMDVRAGLRIGVYRPTSRLNKEQVMDEIESVRMTSQVERVLLEAPQQAELPGVPLEEREYAWATVFFTDAEAADLCATRLCQPGRRSKWPRVSMQRLPLVSAETCPYSTEEEQLRRVHTYQMDSAAADATGHDTSALHTVLPDTVLAQGSSSWCLLSTGGLFPTAGLAAYLRQRRRGEFVGVDICASFDPTTERDTCGAGGLCQGVHLRVCEQWRLLVPVVLVSKKVIPGAGASTLAPSTLAETAWQKARHADALVVIPLPSEIDESAFLYMFRGCDGFLRGQTVRTVDAVRYGVVQFADSGTAHAAQQQACSHSKLSVYLYGEFVASRVQGHASGVSVNPTTPEAGHAPVSGDVASNEDDGEDGRQKGTSAGEGGIAGSAQPSSDANTAEVPFPPLPEGWEYGLSRRTMQYFFLQSGKKSTTWKHPVTQEPYKAKR